MFNIPSSLSFSLPSTWSTSALQNSPFKNKLIFNLGNVNTTLSLSASSNSEEWKDFYGTLIAFNCNLHANSLKIRFYGKVFLNSFSGASLISKSLDSDFCLTDLASATETTLPPTIATPTETQLPSSSTDTQAAPTGQNQGQSITRPRRGLKKFFGF